MRTCASEGCEEPTKDERCPLCQAEDEVFSEEKLSPRELLKASLARLRQVEEEHRALCERLADSEGLDGMAEDLIEIGRLPPSKLKYPIEITDVRGSGLLEWLEENRLNWRKPGTFVSVRPCGDEYEGKTYFGILIGDLPISVGISYDDETGQLHVCAGHGNPAIFVPALGKLIFGCGSFWGPIKDPEQVRKITDDEIQNLWYMKAIKAQLAGLEGDA